MREIIKLATEIKSIAETSSPVIFDLSEKLLHILELEEIYTKEEVMEVLDRRDGIDNG